MKNEQEFDYSKVVEKLGIRLANVEIELAKEQIIKEYYVEEYHKLKAQTENKSE